MRCPLSKPLALSALVASLLLPGCAALDVPDKPSATRDARVAKPVKGARKPKRQQTVTRSRSRAKPTRRPSASSPPKPVELPDVIEAEEFRVVDKEGNVRATLRLGDGGIPGLALYDEDGRLRAVLQVLEDGSPHLLFLDENGNTPTSLHSLP